MYNHTCMYLTAYLHVRISVYRTCETRDMRTLPYRHAHLRLHAAIQTYKHTYTRISDGKAAYFGDAPRLFTQFSVPLANKGSGYDADTQILDLQKDDIRYSSPYEPSQQASRRSSFAPTSPDLDSHAGMSHSSTATSSEARPYAHKPSRYAGITRS